ncbi:hypothetical protein KOR34_48030 [Posidoniimonas corsicana]|uniref:Addiction module component n=1 Tax=Posidoniimonas corsicana TaxID=1938618 RepID=A0A5C5UXS8_9BACT|nr:hypothetical protein [Posidoniimonas corsicana]TWT30245.1 hypothetical protein KOR34_48030 [Posidoniimonas corsicana]
MAVTIDDLNLFHQFAAARLDAAGAESLEQLLLLWRQECNRSDDLEAVRRGVADAEAGRVLPVSQAFAEVRQSLQEGR